MTQAASRRLCLWATCKARRLIDHAWNAVAAPYFHATLSIDSTISVISFSTHLTRVLYINVTGLEHPVDSPSHTAMLTTQGKQKADSLVRQILNGTEHIVSHPGTSQYEGQKGISACGLASLNFARVILAKEAGGSNYDLLQTVIASETAQVDLLLHFATGSPLTTHSLFFIGDNSHLCRGNL